MEKSQIKNRVSFSRRLKVAGNGSKKKLSKSFYLRPTLVVARDLLGRYLVVRINGKVRRGKIVETEAYIGPHDKASHSFGGKRTKRNEVEYWEGGHVYIYLCYGMYWQFNVTTNAAGKPECVLIRALEPISYPDLKVAAGPGKLCCWLGLDGSFYSENLVTSKRIWLEEGEKVKRSEIVSSQRIGIDYAKEWAKKPWRFYLKNSFSVSKK